MAAPVSDQTLGDIPSVEELIKPAEDVVGAESSTDEANNPDFNPWHPREGSDTADTSQDLVASEEAGVLQEPSRLDTERPESSNQPHTAIGRHDNLEARDGGKERHKVEETSSEGRTQRGGEGDKEMLDDVSAAPANDEQTGQPSDSAPEELRGQVEPSNSAPEELSEQIEPPDSAPEVLRGQVEPSNSAPEEPSEQVESPDLAPEELKEEVEPSDSAPEEPREQVEPSDLAPEEQKEEQVDPLESAPEGQIKQVKPPDLSPEELKEEQVKPPESAPDEPKEQVEPPASSPDELKEVEQQDSIPEEQVEPPDSVPEEQVEPSDSAPEEPKVEEQKEPEDTIPENLFYDYNSICSQPFITPNSGIPSNVLHMLHSFGYDCTRRANLHLLDDRTLLYVAGTVTVIVTLKPPEQRYLRSSSGGGIGAVAVHPSKKYFAVAEKGKRPNIVIYEYPSLKPYRILRGGTMEAYAFADFNASGTLLASVGSSPDFMLTLWDWKQEKIMLRSKAFSQDVFQVTFSPDNEEQLTTCGTGHIKFWKMARTFTGLKLQGDLGRFGKTSLTDIEGYVELPDGKVISGSEWGNMLLWEGGLIKVELCRKGRRPCHNGPINQFVLDEGELITIGVDGYVRVWDFETVDTADTIDDTGLLEMEPMNELHVEKDVSLRFMVKMAEADSPMWFAQDAHGAIWKLDLSFSNITQDPECIFSFHSRNITALDASPSTHLMASTSLDRSVRIYDFVGKTPLAEMKFKQGGTALVWAPRMVNPKGGLFVAGFEDGVVRILEVYNPLGFRLVAGRTGTRDAEISLKQAFKPHSAAVTALSYERNGEILATGSEDNTVFFFAVREKYEPIGFVGMPGPVVELHWSPSSHEQNTLLVLCKNGYAVQIPAPAAEKRDPAVTYEIPDLPLQNFRFSSIKSKIEREEEIARRQKEREEKKKELEAWITRQKELGVEVTEEEEMQQKMDEEEEALPPLYIPENPSSILCGFYATPGKFWLSLDGYDAGYLYLCEFTDSHNQTPDPSARRDEPLQALPVDDAASNPIYKAHFSSNKQLLFCGMQDGSIRVYPLQATDPLLTSMHGYWSLGIHDNQYGTVRAICCSYDHQYLVSCGADGNIFTFSILSMEDIERHLKVKKAKVPSPRRDLEREKPAEDIDDPNAYSIENAKQKRQYDLQLKQAEERKAAKRQELARLRDDFRLLLARNTKLPAHMQLGRAEFEMDSRIREEMERQTSERIHTVMKELVWEQEKHNMGLKKLQERFRDDLEFDTVTVHGIVAAHQVSTFRLPSLSEKYKVKGLLGKTRQVRLDQDVKEAEASSDGQELEKAEQSAGEERQVKVYDQKQSWAGKSRAAGHLERMKKVVEKTEKMKSKITNRKQEWAELYKQKPSWDYEDPKDVLAIKNAKENMGDFKLKTASDYTVPEHLRINAEKKRNELAALECMIHKKKKAINLRILSLRDFKVNTIKEIQCLVEELTLVQSTLHSSMHLPVPPVPSMLPDEVPEKRFQFTSETLLKFKLEQEGKVPGTGTSQQAGFGGLGGFGSEKNSAVMQEEAPFHPSPIYEPVEKGSPTSIKPTQAQETERSDLEKEIMQMEEIKNIYKQEKLIQKVNRLVASFDAELQILRHQKLKLDVEMKMGDLRHITLFEELLLLKDFEKREDILQERVNERMVEKEEVQRKSEDYLQQLEAKKKDIAQLQEKEKALHSAFQASLGENNKFAVFLTKVFKKKVKRTKKEVRGDDDDDIDSDDDSDMDSSWDSADDDSGSDGDVFDDSICPDNCDPALFENTLQLREKRLDIEEALTEEKKIVENLKKEYDALTKKAKIIDGNLKAAEEELDVFQREKQQKLNELHVVVPMKLHQVEYTVNGEIPSDLSQALVFSRRTKESLEQRILELDVEREEHVKLLKAAREQHKLLIRERKEMEGKIQKLEDQCHQQMMRKFGRLVDLESLQTLSVNSNLEELKIKSSEHQQKMDKEIEEWEAKVVEVKKGLMEVTREQTRKLEKMNELLTEMKSLEAKLDALQTNVGEEFQGLRNAEVKERKRLVRAVEAQAEEIESLKEEISLLSKKGGSILPPAHHQVPAAHSSTTV